MKILHVAGSMASDAGGTTEAVLRIVEVSETLGVNSEVVTLDHASSRTVSREFLKLHQLGSGKFGTYAYSPLLSKWLHKNIERFDAVIIHGMWQYHGVAASRACRKHAIPYFVFTHGMLDPWFNETYPLKKLKKQLYWPLFEHPVLHYARSLLFTCEEEQILARQSFKPYRVREQVVGLGTIHPPGQRESYQRAFEDDTPEWGQESFLLFMSRIQEKKGLDILLEAYEQLNAEGVDLPNLVIAGPTQQKAYAAELKKRYNQPAIQWIGSLQGDLKWQALASAEAMILPSHQENFGIVVAEALALGTPVLITDKVNIWREVSETKSGLIGEDTVSGIRNLLLDWLNTNNEQRRIMTTAAIACFDNTFDIKASTRKLLDYVQTNIAP